MDNNTNFSTTLQKVFSVAEKLAKDYGSSYIGSEHLVMAMLTCPECTACKLLIWSRATEGQFKEYFVRSIDKRANINGYTPRTKETIDKAVELGGTITRTEHLLMVILNSDECLAMRILRAMGADIKMLKFDTEFVVNLGAEQ